MLEFLFVVEDVFRIKGRGTVIAGKLPVKGFAISGRRLEFRSGGARFFSTGLFSPWKRLGNRHREKPFRLESSFRETPMPRSRLGKRCGLAISFGGPNVLMI